MIGRGNWLITWLSASNTQMAALFGTDRLIVQPVAMSVAVRVNQISPVELPPSWPTRSISMNSDPASSHSAQVRTDKNRHQRPSVRRPGPVFKGERLQPT